MLRRLLILLAPLSALLPSLPAVALDVTRDSQSYVVEGANTAEIRASLDRLGPLDPNTGRRFDAYTRWYLEWRFDSHNSWQGCEITRVWTLLRVTMLLPRHNSPSSLPETVREEWTRYLQRLVLHEEGHVRIPSEAAREIETALDRLHRSDCATLEREANRIGNEALQRARATEQGYDNQTDHGHTQGARFPWTEGADDQLTDNERRKLRDRIAQPH
jgi:predicted secreted Zn-dependent protease